MATKDRDSESRAEGMKKRRRSNSQNAVIEPWGVHNAYVLTGMKRMSQEAAVVSR
jgi:hypothetical protein